MRYLPFFILSSPLLAETATPIYPCLSLPESGVCLESDKARLGLEKRNECQILEINAAEKAGDLCCYDIVVDCDTAGCR